jgi:hypothetical protein
MSFLKIKRENRMAKQVLSEGLVPGEGEKI